MARVVVVRPAAGKIGAVDTRASCARRAGSCSATSSWRGKAGQSTALDHWDIAQGRDVGSVTASDEARKTASDAMCPTT